MKLWGPAKIIVHLRRCLRQPLPQRTFQVRLGRASSGALHLHNSFCRTKRVKSHVRFSIPLLAPNGFTLLEVMVALAIFGVAIMEIVSFQSRGQILNNRARRLTEATMLARQKMVEYQLKLEQDILRGAFPEEGAEEGEFDKPYEMFKYKIEFKKVEIPAPPAPEGGADMVTTMMGTISKQISAAVRELKLVVSWNEMDKEKNITVTTHLVKLD